MLNKQKTEMKLEDYASKLESIVPRLRQLDLDQIFYYLEIIADETAKYQKHIQNMIEINKDIKQLKNCIKDKGFSVDATVAYEILELLKETK